MRKIKHALIRTLTICLTFLYVTNSYAQSGSVATLFNAQNSSNINGLTVDANGNLFYFEQGSPTGDDK